MSYNISGHSNVDRIVFIKPFDLHGAEYRYTGGHDDRVFLKNGQPMDAHEWATALDEYDRLKALEEQKEIEGMEEQTRERMQRARDAIAIPPEVACQFCKHWNRTEPDGRIVGMGYGWCAKDGDVENDGYETGATITHPLHLCLEFSRK